MILPSLKKKKNRSLVPAISRLFSHRNLISLTFFDLYLTTRRGLAERKLHGEETWAQSESHERERREDETGIPAFPNLSSCVAKPGEVFLFLIQHIFDLPHL